jgi:hypothetical protein
MAPSSSTSSFGSLLGGMGMPFGGNRNENEGEGNKG